MLCLIQRHELSPALPVHCTPPTAPSAAGAAAPAGSGTRVALQAVTHILMDVSLPIGHLYAVPTPLQWITSTGTGFLSKLSRKEGSAGIAFKSA